MATEFLLNGSQLGNGIGLCLSGGGYRAMLFHAGAIFRLNDAGLLSSIDRISSVSGGSIAAGALAVAFDQLNFVSATGSRRVATNLRENFLEPILRQAEDAIDAEAIVLSFSPWSSALDKIAASYRRNIVGSKTLQDLPGSPDFVFNATNLMSGRNWRFAKSYSADYRVGKIDAATIPLADVLAASSAFPPFLSPAIVDLTPFKVEAFSHDEGAPDLLRSPFTDKAVLTDGGVYDNMGLEPVWKRYRTILVSNAGQPFADHAEPSTDWLGQTRRVIDIMMDQEKALRLRLLMYAYNCGERTGAYWGLPTPIDKYGVSDAGLLTEEQLQEASTVRTRLDGFNRNEQQLLLTAGYAHADAALRAHFKYPDGTAVGMVDQASIPIA